MNDNDEPGETIDDAPPSEGRVTIHNADEGMPERQHQIMRRGFDGVQLAHEGPATQALIAKETATIQARWIMALRAPRNLLQVRQLLLKECQQPGFAEKAIYSVPRGGNNKVTGMSIRFAEVGMRVMGNMSCESVTIFDNDEERLVRVTVTDYETNAHWQRDITVKKTIERKQLRRNESPIRTRINSFGDPVYICEATDDDTRTKEAAEISKAARTGILRLIPGHITAEMRSLCERLQLDKNRADPGAELKKIVDNFADRNVLPAQLEAYLGHPMDQIVPAEITMLQQLFRGLREGDITSWAEAMEGSEAARKVATEAHKKVVAAARAAQQQGQPAGQAAPGPAAGQARPAQTAPTSTATAQPAETKTSSGKGTQAAKEKLAKKDEKPADPPAAKKDEKPTPAPLELVPQDRGAPEVEFDCALCGVPGLMAAKDTPKKDVMCEACRNS